MDEMEPVPDVTGQPCDGCATPTQFSDLATPVGFPGTKRLLCPKCIAAKKEEGKELAIEERVKKRSAKAVSRTMRVISLAGSMDEESSPNPAILFNAMCDEAGGLERVAAIWWETIESLKEDKQRIPLLREINNFAKLLVSAAPKVEESINYRELSDEELALQQRLSAERAFAMRLLEKHPDLKLSIEEVLADSKALVEESRPEVSDENDDEEDEDE